ncbi:hypothetical protein ACFU5P_15710 [Streptomyces sp. NPDC057433]|uniref:hypothetical protein n=1 Tax=Streptomyces sp. NPDC057433 TaxID=3346132 RepID=UPI0036764B93
MLPSQSPGSPAVPGRTRTPPVRPPRRTGLQREPSLFVDDCVGVERLRAAGVTVVELPELAVDAKAANTHLLGTG